MTESDKKHRWAKADIAEAIKKFPHLSEDTLLYINERMLQTEAEAEKLDKKYPRISKPDKIYLQYLAYLNVHNKQYTQDDEIKYLDNMIQEKDKENEALKREIEQLRNNNQTK